MKTMGTRVMGIAVVAALTVGVSVPVSATESWTKGVIGALTAVTAKSKSAATSVLSNVAESKDQFDGSQSRISKHAGVEVTVPIEAVNEIQIKSPKENNLGIQLPFSGDAANAVELSSGVVAYDNKNSSVSVPIVKNDGSIQLVTVLTSSTAPSDYLYKFRLPKGSSIFRLGDGVVFMNQAKFIGAIAAPWAKDANGLDVPTHYEVSGTTVIQVVDHLSDKFAYPIVADPWFGVNLFSSIYISDRVYRSQPVVNLNLSPWGWLVYSGIAQGSPLPPSFAAGQAILNTAGWEEAWSKGGAIRGALDKPSQREQFSCHALGAIAAGDWNIEKGRPNRLNGNWGAGVAFHHCNWKFAEGSQWD